MGLKTFQIVNLINYYGEGILFKRKIEKLVKNFLKTRSKIKELENRSLGKNEPKD